MSTLCQCWWENDRNAHTHLFTSPFLLNGLDYPSLSALHRQEGRSVQVDLVSSIWAWSRSLFVSCSKMRTKTGLTMAVIWTPTFGLCLIQEDSGNTSDEENSLTQEEIQEFVKRNQQFYKKRLQSREALKEKFLKYCNAMHHKLWPKTWVFLYQTWLNALLIFPWRRRLYSMLLSH